MVLFWNSDLVVSLKSFSKSHIDVFVTNEDVGDREWRFTGFYGEPARARRKRWWVLMTYLQKEYDLPWLCAGDFNEVTSAGEQCGGHGREEWQMEGFHDAIEECRFEDLGYIGLPYTWDNRQQGGDNIKVRLDRALANDNFP